MIVTDTRSNRPEQPLKAHIRSHITQGRSRVASLDGQLRAFVGESPLVALLVAVASGYVLARLASRY